MPTFSNEPPKDPRGQALKLIRTPTTGSLKAHVTSEDLVGTFTHFWKGRTLPCDKDDCAACKEGMPYRWHAWLSIRELRSKQHFLFECTAQAAQQFVQYRKTFGTLRGCAFEAYRPSKRPNGTVYIRTQKVDLTDIQLPAPPDLIKCLSIIWNVSTSGVTNNRMIDDIPTLDLRDASQPILHTPTGNGRR